MDATTRRPGSRDPRLALRYAQTLQHRSCEGFCDGKRGLAAVRDRSNAGVALRRAGRAAVNPGQPLLLAWCSRARHIPRAAAAMHTYKNTLRVPDMHLRLARSRRPHSRHAHLCFRCPCRPRAPCSRTPDLCRQRARRRARRRAEHPDRVQPMREKWEDHPRRLLLS
jgi:hypothetical protein